MLPAPPGNGARRVPHAVSLPGRGAGPGAAKGPLLDFRACRSAN
jgi:hypothetical protein